MYVAGYTRLILDLGRIKHWNNSL